MSRSRSGERLSQMGYVLIIALATLGLWVLIVTIATAWERYGGPLEA